MEIRINAEVKNNLGQVGRITSFEDGRITVSFSDREMKFKEDAFLEGYLFFVDSRLQEEVEEEKLALQKKKDSHLKAVNEANAFALELAKIKEKKALEEENKKLSQVQDVSSEHNVILLRKQPAWSSPDSWDYQKQCKCLGDYHFFDVEKGEPSLKQGGEGLAGISLFSLGPVKTEDGFDCANLGLYWELSKVFPCHSLEGSPNQDYLAYRTKFLKKSIKTQSKIKRPWLPLSYETRGEVKKYKDEQCLYHAYYDSETKTWKALQESEARKKILLPNYLRLVSSHPTFLKLKEEVEKGGKLALVAPDVFNFYSEGARKTFYSSCLNKYKGSISMFVPSYGEFQKISSVRDLLNFPLPFSHACILKAMLDGELSFDEGEGKVVDHAGILTPKAPRLENEKKNKRKKGIDRLN